MPGASTQVDSLLEVIQTSCCTANPEDGMIFVSEVVDAVRIRDGARGERALRDSAAAERMRQIS